MYITLGKHPQASSRIKRIQLFSTEGMEMKEWNLTPKLQSKY